MTTMLRADANPLADVRGSDRNLDRVYFVSSGVSNLLGAERCLPGLQFIASIDPFDGRWGRIALRLRSRVAAVDIYAETVNLMRAAEEHDIFRGSTQAHGLFLMFDERVQTLARRLGLNVCLPDVEMRAGCDDKVAGTRLAQRAGVTSVPNVLAPIRSFQDLRSYGSALGRDLVVQLPFGDSGHSTFFISSEEDFNRHAAEIASQPLVKVMKRIHCRQFTIEGCCTRAGVFVGPLMRELVGFRELTPYPGGWCGNELGSTVAVPLPFDLRLQAQRATTAIGRELAKDGYRGYFGIDLLLDEDTGNLYFGELNPRITGATPLSTQAALHENLPPLISLHMLEWLDRPIPYDPDEFNGRMLAGCGIQPLSMLLMKNTAAEFCLAAAPASGIWRLDGGRLCFVRESFDPADLAGEDEVYLLRSVDTGQIVPKGAYIVRVFLRGGMLDANYRLSRRAHEFIQAIQGLFR